MNWNEGIILECFDVVESLEQVQLLALFSHVALVSLLEKQCVLLLLFGNSPPMLLDILTVEAFSVLGVRLFRQVKASFVNLLFISNTPGANLAE